jgi:thiamine biosynthesis protein ThiS
MKLQVNGQERDFLGTTVAHLVASLGLSGRPVAVEVNRRLVPRADHPTSELRDGDQVEVVTLVGGG